MTRITKWCIAGWSLLKLLAVKFFSKWPKSFVERLSLKEMCMIFLVVENIKLFNWEQKALVLTLLHKKGLVLISIIY